MLEFHEYSERAHATAFYSQSIKGNMPSLVYAALGVGGESGELLEKIKKLYRDSGGNLDEDIQLAIIKEAGDVLWYLNEVALMAGSSLEKVAEENLKKLEERTKRKTLQGSGDDR